MNREMTLYIATSNPGKLRDFAAAAAEVAGTNIRLEPLPDLAYIPAPPEDEPSFHGNAASKAIYYSLRAPGMLVLADDSGLEVDALGGAPGVRSARYADGVAFASSAGMPTDERNNSCLLDALKDVSEADRSARYHCVLAAAKDGRIILTADGTVEGHILGEPRGTSGFGYDPLFLLPEMGKTMAELDASTKLAFSHRGRALKKLLAAWAE
ncbi:MAG TPA: non-canonical purine NTP pyrophosphatase [Edaphobacter sp.]|nr:non-canonical purine NTP pyrophosphatase [Edaphobacter sp.]